MRYLTIVGGILAAFALGVVLLTFRTIPDTFTYGVSFSKLHADELQLDWQATYLAILDDLHVKRLRLSAHWPMIEPEQGAYSFEELDFQMNEAAKRDAKVILAVGRKAPGWPECHTPPWATELSSEDEQAARLTYITAVVNRYKHASALEMWQVENEPFLDFARHLCGEPDEEFFKEEVRLVRKLDPDHPILVTDGGEFGFWYKARAHGDMFGSTMYLYIWSSHFGYWRYPISGWFFRAKQNLLDLVAGEKKSISVEVGLEPWLNKPIVETPLDEQLMRMSLERFSEILNIAATSGFDTHYLWGAEWWYYMKVNGHGEFWERARSLFER